jgi:hypothetical protein
VWKICELFHNNPSIKNFYYINFYLHGNDTSGQKGVVKLGRGKSFEHKNKNHPGNFPENSLTEKHSKEKIGDEELIVVQEAFKNRVGGEENT